MPEEPEPASEYPPELLYIAQVVNWYTKPEEILRHTGLFLNQVMARGGPEELQVALKHYTKEQFQAAYENAPAGEYYRPRWAYWGLKLFGNPEHKPYPIRFPAYDLPYMGFPDR